MANFIININEKNFFVENIRTIETECSNYYEFIIYANNNENINITLNGDHIEEYIIQNNIETKFTNSISLSFNNNLIVKFSIPNSSIIGKFNNCNLLIENTDTISNINSYNYFLERLNDKPCV